MPRIRRRPTSTAVIEQGVSEFASKTAARLAKLSPEERAARLAAFKTVVERDEPISKLPFAGPASSFREEPETARR